MRALLWDVEAACQLLAVFTEGIDEVAYCGNELLRSAVERQLLIVGEALAQASRLDRKAEQRVTDLRRVVDFRNRLVHGYAAIADDVVWGVVQLHVPKLAAEVRAWLDELEGVDS